MDSIDNHTLERLNTVRLNLRQFDFSYNQDSDTEGEDECDFEDSMDEDRTIQLAHLDLMIGDQSLSKN